MAYIGVKPSPETGIWNIDITGNAATTNMADDTAKLGGAVAADYAKLLSPAITGTPTVPTAAAGTNTTQIASTAFVGTAVSNMSNAIVGAAPVGLNTLVEIATSIGNDTAYASTVSTALGLKAPLASPALTGTPTVPTAAAGTNTTQIASTAFVGTAVSNLVASAPAALNTLNELATALGNDANFATTVTNSISTKAPLTGGGASGTWGINITGNATTATTASYLALSPTTYTHIGAWGVAANAANSALVNRAYMSDICTGNAATATTAAACTGNAATATYATSAGSANGSSLVNWYRGQVWVSGGQNWNFSYSNNQTFYPFSNTKFYTILSVQTRIRLKFDSSFYTDSNVTSSLVIGGVTVATCNYSLYSFDGNFTWTPHDGLYTTGWFEATQVNTPGTADNMFGAWQANNTEATLNLTYAGYVHGVGGTHKAWAEYRVVYLSSTSSSFYGQGWESHLGIAAMTF